MLPALSLVGLHRSFGAKHAVADLTLSVEAGRMFGLVGPNGAGKTTTLSMATGKELLRYIGLLRRVPRADIASRSEDLLAALGLAEDGDTLVVEYSAGMTKKIGLACALIHAPRLLILDEPFEAVDPVSGEGIRQILRSYVRGGGTVVLSSHVMELVENLCDSLAVIAEGRVLAAGSIDEVRAGSSLQQRFLELVGFQGER